MNQVPTDAAARARGEQQRASYPRASAFVSASAGSGKTKLLIDRLLRLMLDGADPGRIQCLTFTKAAAAEMALRLQAVLGEWVTLGEEALDAALTGLEVEPTAETRAAARALFVRVLDLPGGMRIGTIHAFCQSLLRRFPLEAELSPHFRLVDESDTREALDDAREDTLGGDGQGVRAFLEEIAGLAKADTFARLMTTLAASGTRLEPAFALDPAPREAALRRAARIGAEDEPALLRAAAAWPEEAALAEALRRVAAQGSRGVGGKAARMLAWLACPVDERAARWEEWRAWLLTDKGDPRKDGAFLNPTLVRQDPALVEPFRAEAARVLKVEDDRRALRAVKASAALIGLAEPVLHEYEDRKRQGGLLDYDDLIERTSELLVDPGAAWVLYKLDGGLDHLLLDEVQDTAPAQWRIAGALLAEFFAGIGARDRLRTFFAVGDPKQSIYSFQGADPEAFEQWRARLRAEVEASGNEWREVPLDVSFRSTAPVLALVDAVFADPLAAAGVVQDGDRLTHYPNRTGHAGAVELWPLAPPPDEPEAAPWAVPDRNLGLSSAPQRLADAIAAWISSELENRVRLESRDRPLGPGDVLVLVRRRNDFARALVRALKTRNVPVAGLDRLVLTDQPAVQDLLALLDVLLLPEDDLALASLLTSPLGGLSDESLMHLAMDRPGSLWDALRDRAAERDCWGAATEFVSRLLGRTDYASPHALLAEALGPLGGRTRLLARLGPEAAEAVDELLGRALGYAASHPPSLQGFVQWLRRSGAEVKREGEGAGDAVRLMTVHGAKGLQAPLVILPDTTGLPLKDESFAWSRDPETGAELPLWTPRNEFAGEAVRKAREAASGRRMAEYNRLLYVALTRAEDRLVVCGWQSKKGIPNDCWYRLVERGFGRLPGAHAAFGGGWSGQVVRYASEQSVPPLSRAVTAPPQDRASSPPAWVHKAPRPEPARPTPLAPSRPEGVRLGPVPGATSPLAARLQEGQRFRRGKLVHALLQHLPSLAADARAAAAAAYAGRRGHGLGPAEIDALVAEVLAVLDDPRLAPLFGPGSRAELPLSGEVGGRVVNGVVDRLAVREDGVWLADYKSNRAAPGRPEATPVLYLRQMAAYRAVLRGIFPGRAVHCFLVWTEEARVLALPDALLDPHAPGAPLDTGVDTSQIVARLEQEHGP